MAKPIIIQNIEDLQELTATHTQQIANIQVGQVPDGSVTDAKLDPNGIISVVTEFSSDIDGGDFTMIPSTDVIDGGVF